VPSNNTHALFVARPQSLHPPSGAGPMLGHQGAGAGAGLEPASVPEPLPAAGGAEHCCRGGRSSGYWVPALTCQFFFTTVIYRLKHRLERLQSRILPDRAQCIETRCGHSLCQPALLIVLPRILCLALAVRWRCACELLGRSILAQISVTRLPTH
jgi:hypothetical protein